MKKRILSLTVAICMIFGFSAILPEGVFDNPTSIVASAEESIGENEIHNYKEISYSLDGIKNQTYQFTYKDDMFNTNSNELSTDLAKMSVGLAMAAYDEDTIRGALTQMGFEYDEDNVKNYDSKRIATYDDNDFVAYTIANKITTFNGEKYNIVLVPIRGTHGDPEWFSDFNLGTGRNHKGFYMAAQDINMDLWNFLSGYKQYDSDHTIILTTGHSRGAAVANIVAGMYTKTDGYNKFASRDHVFAYTFACPAVSKDADESLLNIYNYNNCGDVIPELPLKGEGWEYKRFGRTITLEAKGLEYQNFLQRFKLHNRIEYAGMTDTTMWIETFKSLADTPDEYNEPFNQFLFGFVASYMGPGVYSWTQLFAIFCEDWWAKQNIEFIDATLFGKIKMLFSDLYSISRTIVWDLPTLSHYLFEDDLTDLLTQISVYLVDTNGMTDEDFSNYISSINLSSIEKESEIKIKTRSDLIEARRKIFKMSEDLNRIAPKIATIINLFFAAENDAINPNSEGSFSGLKAVLRHGHTGDTYILWINSLYYGFEGWKGTDVAPESLPDNIITLGYNCFSENTALTSIEIPKEMIKVNANDFAHCSSLKSVVIHDNIIMIEPVAFYDCKKLTSITIPCDVETGGIYLYGDFYSSFQGCDSLSSIHYTYGKTGEMLNYSYSNYTETLPYTLRSTLKTVTFDDNITHIGDYAFYDSWALEQAQLPSKLKTIGNSAFRFTKIQSIDLPDSIESIGSYAFYATRIDEIKIPPKLNSIPEGMCYLCSNITSVVIPDSVREIGSLAFSECENLTSITIPCDILPGGYSPGDFCSSFYNCDSLSSIHYTYGKTGEMLNYSYSNYTETLPYTLRSTLKTVTFDDNITHIGDYAFYDSWALENVKLPSALKTIGESVFRFTKIHSIDLPDSVESIGEAAFCGTAIDRIDFPAKLTIIPKSMCSRCRYLAELSIPSSVTTIGSYAFHDCDNLNDVTYDGYKEDWDKIEIGEYNEPLENAQCKVKPCEHQYTSEVTTPATCTTDGVRKFTCSKCNDSYTEEIKDLGHNWGAPTYTWSSDYKTCTATRICANDPSHKETETVNSTSKVKTAATCTAKGTTTYTVKFSNSAFAAQTKDVEDIDVKDHSYGTPTYTWSTDKKSCTAKAICNNDTTHIVTETITATYAVTTPATTTSEGVGTYTAKFTNNLFKTQTTTIKIPKEAYVWGKPTYKWSSDYKTCTATRVATNDSTKKETETVNSTSMVKTAATCTIKGITTYTAEFENNVFEIQTKDVQDIELIDHQFGAWRVTTDPTCTAKGIEIRKCKNCEATETRDVKALGHNYKDTIVAPTCTSKGYTLHKCSRCKDEYIDTETEKTAHSFSDWTVTTAPTCTAKGVETRKCKNCEATVTRDVKSLGHDYKDTIVAPTCITNGYTNHKCTRCSVEYNDTEIEMTAHSFGDWDIKSYDPKTGKSKLVRKCENCTHTETKTEKGIVQRYAGSGRFATAAEISKGTFESAKTVVLAYGLNSADALAGVPLAAKYNAPILLTHTKTLPSETLAEIKRLGATKVIILGGEGAIGKEVENALKKEKITTQRIAGKTRFGTATAIAEQLTETPEEIFFVYAFNFADALSASTVAAVKGAPIIYLKTSGELDADTAAYLAKVKGKVKRAYVIGGTGVISDDMMNKVSKALGLDSVTRVAGANRYATCIEVNNKFKDVLTGNGICVAKGLDFPDALAGGAFAALKKMPLFLADGNLKDIQSQYLGDKEISNVYIFGGTGAVPDNLVEIIAKAS